MRFDEVFGGLQENFLELDQFSSSCPISTCSRYPNSFFTKQKNSALEKSQSEVDLEKKNEADFNKGEKPKPHKPPAMHRRPLILPGQKLAAASPTANRKPLDRESPATA